MMAFTMLMDTLRGNGKRLFAIALQIVLSLLLMNQLIHSYQSVRMSLGQLESLNISELHYIRSLDDHEIWVFSVGDRNDRADRVKEFYDFLTTSEDFDFYTIAFENRLYANLPFTEIPQRLETVFLSPNSTKHFDLPLSEGSFFQDRTYHLHRSWEYFPVVLGANYQSKLSLGDRFRLMDYSRESLPLEIIGFLEPGAIVIQRNTWNPVLQLDDAILLPVLNPDYIPEQRFGVYDTYIHQSVMFTHDADTALNAIQKKSRELSLESYTLQSQEEIIQLQRDRSREDQQIYFLLLFLLISFTSLGIISTQLYRIYSQKVYHAIHLLCGSSMRHFILSVILEVFVMLVVGWVVFLGLTAVIPGLQYPWTQLFLLFSFIAIIVYSFILSIIPVVILMNTRLTTLLRRAE